MTTTSSTTNTPFSWLSIEGRTIIREIIEEKIPEWSGGPRESQVECWAHILANIPVVLIAPTGWGKTAAFYGPIIILEHLLKHPKSTVPSPPPTPVVLIVTPLIELGRAHAREISSMGVRSISLSAESIRAASEEGRDLIKEVCACEWPIVLLSAERLVSKDIDAVIRNENFRKNLILLGIDETHLLVPWGQDFRKAYHQIGLLRKRLPSHTALIALTATLALGKETDDLFAILGLTGNKPFRCIRLSCERPNVRMVFSELTHTLGGYQFPDIAWVFERGVKAVIFCKSIDLAFRVALYGWNLQPDGARRLDNVRLWTSITSPSYNTRTLDLFINNEDTSAIVATIAFSVGMNLRDISDSINLGLPSSLAALIQQNGRAGRDLVSAARGWTYIEGSVLSNIRAELEREEMDTVDKDTEVTTAKKGRKAISKARKQVHATDKIESNLRQSVIAHVRGDCLIAEVNTRFGNPGPNSKSRCIEAGRPFPCSSCEPFWNNPAPRPMPAGFIANSSVPTVKDTTVTLGPFLPSPLSKAFRANASSWLDDFALRRWSLKDDTNIRLLPHLVFWTGTSVPHILDIFHFIRSRESLDTHLSCWKYLSTDGDALFSLVQELNMRFDEHLRKQKTKKLQKAADTRARNKQKQKPSESKENAPSPLNPPPPPKPSGLTIRLPPRNRIILAPMVPSSSTNSTIAATTFSTGDWDDPDWEPPLHPVFSFTEPTAIKRPQDVLDDDKQYKRRCLR